MFDANIYIHFYNIFKNLQRIEKSRLVQMQWQSNNSS